MTPAERLLAAADLLDERASEATQGPWEVHEEIDGYRAGRKTVIKARGNRVVTVDQTRTHWDSKAEANVAYIATMHPEVGKALAKVLRATVKRHADDLGYFAFPTTVTGELFALADLLLAGES